MHCHDHEKQIDAFIPHDLLFEQPRLTGRDTPVHHALAADAGLDATPSTIVAESVDVSVQDTQHKEVVADSMQSVLHAPEDTFGASIPDTLASLHSTTADLMKGALRSMVNRVATNEATSDFTPTQPLPVEAEDKSTGAIRDMSQIGTPDPNEAVDNVEPPAIEAPSNQLSVRCQCGHKGVDDDMVSALRRLPVARY